MKRLPFVTMWTFEPSAFIAQIWNDPERLLQNVISRPSRE